MLSKTLLKSGTNQKLWLIETDGTTADPESGPSDKHIGFVLDLDDVVPMVALSPAGPAFFANACAISEVDNSGAFVNVDLGTAPGVAGPVAYLAAWW